MTRVTRLFRNRNFILSLGLVLGFAFGEAVAKPLQPLILPVLALIMTLSATSITSLELTSIRSIFKPIVLALLLNYLVLGGIILAMAYLMIHDADLWTGFVVLAAIPPAVAVAPFSVILGGNVLLSLVSMTLAYLAALLITPTAILIFVGVNDFSPVKLLLILGELIIVPLILSRILIATRVSTKISPWRGTIVNWSFFLIFIISVGLNRSTFFQQPGALLSMIIIAITVSFVLAYIIKLVSRLARVGYENTVSYVLMGTMKNYGLATGILLTLFTERTTIPSAVLLIFGIVQMVWLGYFLKKH